VSEERHVIDYRTAGPPPARCNPWPAVVLMLPSLFLTVSLVSLSFIPGTVPQPFVEAMFIAFRVWVIAILVSLASYEKVRPVPVPVLILLLAHLAVPLAALVVMFSGVRF
jgi:hypothetical protein